MKGMLLILAIMMGQKAIQTDVYVCNSPGARKFHYSSGCRGLRNCTYKVIKKTKKQAEKEGKTLCGWEH